jgi:hypothetical protein
MNPNGADNCVRSLVTIYYLWSVDTYRLSVAVLELILTTQLARTARLNVTMQRKYFFETQPQPPVGGG